MAKEEHQNKEEKKKFLGDNTKSKLQKSLNVNLMSKLGNPTDIELNKFLNNFKKELSAQIEN